LKKSLTLSQHLDGIPLLQDVRFLRMQRIVLFEVVAVNSHVILYMKSSRTTVKNVKVISEIGKTGHPGGQGRMGGDGMVMSPANEFHCYEEETVVKCDFVLPEEQQRMVEDVEELASKHGFSFEVVDLARKNAFSRFRLEHSKKIEILPTLKMDSG
jgi:hypothetical protein